MLLLVIIYGAFISLGLPDAMLGSAWPVMQPDLGVRYAYAGWASMIISVGTVLSSVLATRLLKMFGIGKLLAFSVLLTALALLGFGLSPSFAWLLLAAVPLGLGAGAVDAGLNAFVAEHYESRHMSWLHSFWGLGALCGPFLLSAILAQGGTWRSGYLLVASIQAVLVTVLFLALPLWGKVPRRAAGGDAAASEEHRPLFFPLRMQGVKTALLVFFCYCGIEATMGLWGASFLFKVKGMDPTSAARWVSFYYGAITAGRFLAGFISYKVSNDNVIRSGCLMILAGTLLMVFPLPLPLTLAGFLMVGFGCAPIFPCMLHATPERFGAADSQAVIGFQMAVAYIGTTFLPPAFGFIASGTSLALLPFYLLAFIAVLVAGTEWLRSGKWEGRRLDGEGPHQVRAGAGK